MPGSRKRKSGPGHGGTLGVSLEKNGSAPFVVRDGTGMSNARQCVPKRGSRGAIRRLRGTPWGTSGIALGRLGASHCNAPAAISTTSKPAAKRHSSINGHISALVAKHAAAWVYCAANVPPPTFSLSAGLPLALHAHVCELCFIASTLSLLRPPLDCSTQGWLDLVPGCQNGGRCHTSERASICACSS